MNGHFIERCSCGVVMRQCKCPGPHVERIADDACETCRRLKAPSPPPPKMALLLSGRVEDAPGYIEAKLADGGVRGVIVAIIGPDEKMVSMRFGSVFNHELSLLGFSMQYDAVHE